MAVNVELVVTYLDGSIKWKNDFLFNLWKYRNDINNVAFEIGK